MKNRIINKKIFSKSITLLVLIFFLGCQGCNINTNLSEPPTTTTTYIFVDKTDKESTRSILSEKQVNTVLDNMGGDNIFNGGSLKIMVINDLTMPDPLSFKLPKGNSDFFNGTTSEERSLKVDNFKSEVKDNIKKFVGKLSFGNEQSEIYRNLCKQIKYLNDEKSDKKNVIIFSDMLENSPVFTLYGNIKEENAIFLNAEKVCNFPQMDEINLYIISPENIKNKELVARSEKFWETFFRKKQVKKFNGFSVDLNMD